MKLTVSAKQLAAALGLAASLVDAKLAKKIAVLEAVHLVTEDSAVSLTVNALDFALTMTMPAAVAAAGELATSAPRLAMLAAGFPDGAEIVVAESGTMVLISYGHSRFKLPTLPLGDLPALPTIADELGRIEFERGQLKTLLARPSFAIANEKTRCYLNGICLHGSENGEAIAVATDGHRLAKIALPHISGLSSGHRPIIPAPAIKILLKLLGDKTIDGVTTLRRSANLIEIAAPSFSLVSKLIDSTFPAYERVIPEPSGNTATVDRGALAQAVARVAAAEPDGTKRAPLIGMTWRAPKPQLRLYIPGFSDLADDAVEAEVAGRGRISCQVGYLAELLGELKGARVHIDGGNELGCGVRITSPDDENFLILQMQCVPPAEEVAA